VNKIILKIAKLIYGSISLKCPSCKKIGFISNWQIIGLKIFRFVRYRGGKLIEVKNINCTCENCKNGFRISNGTVIKRKRKSIEIPSNYIQFSSMIFFSSTALLSIFFNQTINPKVDISEIARIPILPIFYLCTLLFLASIWFPLVNFKIRKPIWTSYNIPLKDVEYSAFRHDKKIRKFHKEKEIQLLIAENIESYTFFNKKLNLYESDPSKNAIEYVTPIGDIDILAQDEDENFIVIETKLEKVPDKTIGQISRYMGWVNENLCKKNQSVFGVIIGHRITDKLKYAAYENDRIFLFEYQYGFDFKRIHLKLKDVKN